MKKLLAIIIVLLGIAQFQNLNAQTYLVENQSYSTGHGGGRTSWCVSAYLDTPVSKDSKWSIWAFLLYDDAWNEGVFGIARTIKGNNRALEMGLGAGFEHDNLPLRCSGFACAFDSKNNSAAFFFEYGGSGYWYQTYINKAVNKSLGFGVHGQRFCGFGPRIQIDCLSRLQFWAMFPAYNPEENPGKDWGGMAAVRLKF